MKTSTWTSRLSAPWMVAAALAFPASADSVAVMIQNNSSEQWTLKHGDMGDVTLDLTLPLMALGILLLSGSGKGSRT